MSPDHGSVSVWYAPCSLTSLVPYSILIIRLFLGIPLLSCPTQGLAQILLLLTEGFMMSKGPRNRLIQKTRRQTPTSSVHVFRGSSSSQPKQKQMFPPYQVQKDK